MPAPRWARGNASWSLFHIQLPPWESSCCTVLFWNYFACCASRSLTLLFPGKQLTDRTHYYFPGSPHGSVVPVGHFPLTFFFFLVSHDLKWNNLDGVYKDFSKSYGKCVLWKHCACIFCPHIQVCFNYTFHTFFEAPSCELFILKTNFLMQSFCFLEP